MTDATCGSYRITAVLTRIYLHAGDRKTEYLVSFQAILHKGSDWEYIERDDKSVFDALVGAGAIPSTTHFGKPVRVNAFTAYLTMVRLKGYYRATYTQPSTN